MGRKAKARSGSFLLGAIAALLAIFAAAAPAATTVTHPFLTSFSAGPNFYPGGIAVNQETGNVYVIDATKDVVAVFDKDGAPIAEMDGTDTPAEAGHFRFQATETRVADVAIDNSGGPTDGRIYVGSNFIGGGGQPPDYGIHVFNPSGQFLYDLIKAGFKFEPQGAVWGVAIGPEGKVAWVGETGGDIGYASSMGAYLGKSQLKMPLGYSGIVGVGGLAFGSTGGLYASLSHHGPLARLDAPELVQSPAWVNGRTSAVEIDRTDDDLYTVDDRGKLVSQFDSSGALVRQFGLTKFGQSAGISLNEASGHVYVADPENNRVVVFGPPTTVTVANVTAQPATEVEANMATLHGTINPQGVPSEWRFQYRAKGTKVWTSTALQDAGSGSSDIEVDTPLPSLDQNTTYEFRLQAVNTTNGAINTSSALSFTTEGLPQAIVTINPPTAITPTSAHLSGTVNPNESEATWRFQYTTDPTFEEDWIPIGVANSIPAGNEAVSVETELKGLEPNNDYFVRLVATNDGGPKASEAREFTSLPVPPSVRTIPAGAYGETSIRLAAEVNPRNAPTTYYFEYGTDTGYGSSVPVSEDASAGSGTKDVFLTQDLDGLEPGTTYHYRVVATNAAGTVTGADETFTTIDPSLPGPPQRGIELVNPPEKGNQNVLRGTIAPQGDRVLWAATAGAPGTPNGTSQFVANRTPSGWHSTTPIPPASEQVGGGEFGYTLSLSRPGSAYEWSSPDLSSFIATATTGLFSAVPSTYVRLDSDGHQEVLYTFAGNNFVNATDDLARVVINTNESIALEHPTGSNQVYDIGSGSPELLSRLPGGAVPSCGVPAMLVNSTSGGGGQGFSDNGDQYPWISTEKSAPLKVFFRTRGSSGTCSSSDPLQLYVRAVDAGTTTLISGPAVAGPDLGGAFIRTNPTGTAALFVSETKLDSDDENDRADIYRWDEGGGSKCLTCVVDEARVNYGVSGERRIYATADLSQIYFTSPNKLVGDAGTQGASNLYLWHAGGIEFVATYEAHSSQPLSEGSTSMGFDGSVLFFSSKKRITADAIGSTFQWYRYEQETGNVICVSCRPDGGTSFASPSPFKAISGDGGSVAFLTTEGLVEDDVNQGRDIYEWRNGHLAMVTDGVTEYSADRLTIEGMSDDGTDLIFAANAKLTPGVKDNYGQLYDARAGGGFSPPTLPPAPCVEDACQGPLAPTPRYESPGSSAFSGPANQSIQRAKKKRKRARKKGSDRGRHAQKHRAGKGQRGQQAGRGVGR